MDDPTEVLDLRQRERRPAAPPGFPVAEPLLEDGVAAELVAPDALGNVAETDMIVQEEVAGALAKARAERVLRDGSRSRHAPFAAPK